MSCLKCGRETGEDQVFCEDCLVVMRAHPVRPGTAILLPKRRDLPLPKKVPKKKVPTAEDQLRVLRIRLRLMGFALALFMLLSAALAVPAWQQLRRQTRRKGQNYSVVTVPPTADSPADDWAASLLPWD